MTESKLLTMSDIFDLNNTNMIAEFVDCLIERVFTFDSLQYLMFNFVILGL